jgi:hypothetical protein
MTNNNDNSTEEAIREAISDSVKSSQGVQHSPMPSPERTGIKRPKFTTIDNCGRTQVAGATILSTEDEDHFAWGFAKFQEMFGSAPNVIFTDSDPAMALALAAVWPETVHLLCTFHIWKNFWQHIHPLFVGDSMYIPHLEEFLAAYSPTVCG